MVRYGLTESLIMSALGGVLGIALAWWGLRLLPLIQPERLSRGEDIAISGPVLLFAAGVTLLTAVLSGLAPAARLARRELQGSLINRGRTAGEGGGRLGNALVNHRSYHA